MPYSFSVPLLALASLLTATAHADALEDLGLRRGQPVLVEITGDDPGGSRCGGCRAYDAHFPAGSTQLEGIARLRIHSPLQRHQRDASRRERAVIEERDQRRAEASLRMEQLRQVLGPELTSVTEVPTFLAFEVGEDGQVRVYGRAQGYPRESLPFRRWLSEVRDRRAVEVGTRITSGDELQPTDPPRPQACPPDSPPTSSLRLLRSPSQSSLPEVVRLGATEPMRLALGCERPMSPPQSPRRVCTAEEFQEIAGAAAASPYPLRYQACQIGRELAIPGDGWHISERQVRADGDEEFQRHRFVSWVRRPTADSEASEPGNREATLAVEQILRSFHSMGPGRTLEQLRDAAQASPEARVDPNFVIAVAFREGGSSAYSSGHHRTSSRHHGLDTIGSSLPRLREEGWIPQSYLRRWTPIEGRNEQGNSVLAIELPARDVIMATYAKLRISEDLFETAAIQAGFTREDLSRMSARARRAWTQIFFGKPYGEAYAGPQTRGRWGGPTFLGRLRELTRSQPPGAESPLDQIMTLDEFRDHITVRRALITATEAEMLDSVITIPPRGC